MLVYALPRTGPEDLLGLPAQRAGMTPESASPDLRLAADTQRARKCSFLTRSVAPCQAWATVESGYAACRAHDPARQEKNRQQNSKAAEASHVQLADEQLERLARRADLSTVEGIKVFWDEVTRLGAAGKIPQSRYATLSRDCRDRIALLTSEQVKGKNTKVTPLVVEVQRFAPNGMEATEKP